MEQLLGARHCAKSFTCKILSIEDNPVMCRYWGQLDYFTAFSMWLSMPPPTGERVYLFQPIGSRFGQVICFSPRSATRHDYGAMKDFQWVCIICVGHSSYLLP